MKRLLFIGFLIFIMKASILHCEIFSNSNSITIGFGAYYPSLDYWKDESIISNWDQKFGGNLMVDVNIKIKPFSRLTLSIGTGLWHESISQNNVWFGDEYGKEALTLRFVPVTFNGYYYILQHTLPIRPYLGAGMGINFIEKSAFRERNNKYEKDIDHGKDHFSQFTIGLEKNLFPGMMINLEARYILGLYIQQEKGFGNKIIDKTVSVEGFQILLLFTFRV